MMLTIQRIELRIPYSGVCANSHNIKHNGTRGPRIATPNPRFAALKKLGGKVKATWKKEVDEVRE